MIIIMTMARRIRLGGPATAIGLPARIAKAVDELSTGTVYLRVPLLDDAIQVGTDRRLPTATIAIRKSPSAVEVRRTDGKPLRFQIITRPESGRHERVDVFTDPVGSLRVERIRRADNTDYWTVPTTSVRRRSALVQLVETIVSFSVTKQRRANAFP